MDACSCYGDPQQINFIEDCELIAGIGFDGVRRMVKSIEPHALDMELQSSSEPFLVAFLKKNERFLNQSRALDKASEDSAGKVRCYMYDLDYLDTGMQRFKVKGTPTFLMFADGREINRHIGESDKETLDEFIRSAIPDA